MDRFRALAVSGVAGEGSSMVASEEESSRRQRLLQVASGSARPPQGTNGIGP